MRYVVNGRCKASCSLNEINLPGPLVPVVHSMYEEGKNRETIAAFLAEHQVRVSTASIGRHKGNHLDPGGDALPGDGKPKSHLEILNTIIEQGGQQIGTKGVRISPEMTMKAIEMHHKLTEGSVWEDFLNAIGAMADEDREGGPENPDALQAADEQEQVAADA